MLNTIFSKGSLPVLEQVLYFTARRHDAIAGNIANVETPKYRAIDAPVEDFQEAMDRAIAARDERRIPVFRFEGYGDVKPRPGGGMIVDYIEAPETGILRHIENNVDIDMEMGKLVKNAMLHNLVANIMAQQFHLLQEAIAERVTGG